MLSIFILFVSGFVLISSLNAIPPQYGFLWIDGGGRLMGDVGGGNQQPVRLHGNSLYCCTYEGWQFWTYDTVKALKCNWNANVVRAPVKVDTQQWDKSYGILDWGNWIDGKKAPDFHMQKVREVINAAIELGIYVIVDWHGYHVNYKKEAIDFFKQISWEYRDHAHLIYEILNEPNDVDWNTLKSYHWDVAKAIRDNGARNLILLGTPGGSTDLWTPSQPQNRIDGQIKDLAYVLHFYANTNPAGLKWQVEYARNQSVPVFISEYGTCDDSGKGTVNEGEIKDWWWRLDNMGVSYVNWHMGNTDEASAALKKEAVLKPDYNPVWIDDKNPWQLSWSGKLVRDHQWDSKLERVRRDRC